MGDKGEEGNILDLDKVDGDKLAKGGKLARVGQGGSTRKNSFHLTSYFHLVSIIRKVTDNIEKKTHVHERIERLRQDELRRPFSRMMGDGQETTKGLLRLSYSNSEPVLSFV